MGINAPVKRLLKNIARKVSNSYAGMKGQSGAHVIGLFGLPRSGTTLLTAMIDAHSKAACVYEPWHSTRLHRDQTHLDDLMPLLRVQDKQIKLICAKETATRSYYLTNLDNLLSNASRVSRVSLIWIIRRPIDTYLSQIAADHRWRQGKFNPHPDSLKHWAKMTYATFSQISTLLVKYNSRIVFYDYLTAFPQQALQDLMSIAGLDFEPEQLSYHETIDRRTVRGDGFVRNEPKPVMIQGKEKYNEQIAALVEQYSANEYLSYILQVSEAVSQHCHHGVIKPPHPVIGSLIDCGLNNFPRA